MPCLYLLLTVWAGCVTVDILPDDVILNIFHFVRLIYADLGHLAKLPNGVSFYAGERDLIEWRRSWWYPLIHVCREWRSVIFASPNFLDLRLVCVPYTRIELIGIWPPFPIIIRNNFRPMPDDYDFDAAIVHRNRVCEIDLRLTSLQLKRWAPAMQEQFPALRHFKFCIHSNDRPLPSALPDGFLGGSAPNLQSLSLRNIPFPALPKLLLSATDLVSLFLWYTPHSGYNPPEVISAALAALINLKSLTIGFDRPESPPNQERRRLPCTVLPALTSFTFRGASEYTEVLVARVDAPLLGYISMSFFYQPIFDTPQLAQFMRRATGLKALNEACVDFRPYEVGVEFFSTGTFRKASSLNIPCKGLQSQLSSLAQLLTPFFPSIYTVEHLYIHWRDPRLLGPMPQDEMENLQWLETFQSFAKVKNFYVSERFVQGITHSLRELVEGRLMDVFPALESLFLEGFQSSGPVQETIGQFVAARQLSGHPVTVSHWDKPEGY